MINNLDFISLLNAKMSGLIAEHDLSIAYHKKSILLEEVVYSSSICAIDCFLELRDGYVDFRFGPVGYLDADGLPKWPEYESMKSLGKILRAEGKTVPYGPENLYTEMGLEETIVVLVQGLWDHEELVFGRQG